MLLFMQMPRLRFIFYGAALLGLGALFACSPPPAKRLEPLEQQLQSRLQQQQQQLKLPELDWRLPEAAAWASLRRVLLQQQLAGTLKPPKPLLKDWRSASSSSAPVALSPAEQDLTLTLPQALQVAARNSRSYQANKEAVFTAALNLVVAEDRFATTLGAAMATAGQLNWQGDAPRHGLRESSEVQGQRLFASGVKALSSLSLDVVQLLTAGGAGNWGLAADASIEVPLLGAKRGIVVREERTQARRNLRYALWEFATFRRRFVVNVAQRYLQVVQQRDEVRNNEESYQSLKASAQRAKKLAQAGRLPEIQVDQAVQNELSSRQRWIRSQQNYAAALDDFKAYVGLPVDARVHLDYQELERLAASTRDKLALAAGQVPKPGPYEWSSSKAVAKALAQRLQLKQARGRLQDARRQVRVALAQMEAGLSLELAGGAGSGRGLASAEGAPGYLRPEKGLYQALLQWDLPWERTAETVALRRALLQQQQQYRDLLELEDTIKSQVRNQLRQLRQSREGLRIQQESVQLAKRRVASTQLFLQAGRAQIRDLLEAQNDLVAAQNALTAALVAYRLAELRLQRDMGVLRVTPDGLWQEYKDNAA